MADEHDYSQCQHNCGVGADFCRGMRQLRAGRLCGQVILRYSNGTVVESAVTVTVRQPKDKKAEITIDDLKAVLDATNPKAEIRRLLNGAAKQKATG
jgi:hypothetical protein